MTRTRPVQAAFSSGEIDPLLRAREDYQRQQTGLAMCQGFLPMRQGGFTRAPGTIFRGTTRNNAACRRIPFVFAANDSLSLEFTDGKMRVWRYGALVDASGGGTFELDTPYTDADLPNLDWMQDNDILYIVDGRQPMQKLSRLALNDWTIAEADLRKGPFLVQNLDKDKTIQCSGASTATAWSASASLAFGTEREYGGRIYELTNYTQDGVSINPGLTGTTPPTHGSGSATLTWTTGGGEDVTVNHAVTWLYLRDVSVATEGETTITGTGDIFAAADVGTLLRVEPTDITDVALWVGNLSATTGTLWRYDGNIYQLSGANTGLEAPVHDAGTVVARASSGTVTWTWVSSEVGILRINEYVNANEVVAEVLKPLPQPVIDDPTYRWAKSAWSETAGYPAAITRFRRRMYAANTETEPRTVWASVIGDFEDFEPSELDDAAFAYEIEGAESRNEIRWLKGGQKGVYIGAASEVYLGAGDGPRAPITPLTFNTELVDAEGAAGAQPVLPFGFPIYITANGGSVVESRYSFETEGNKPLEISLPSQHLGGEGFAQIVWQKSPGKLGWVRRDSGDLVAMIYDPDQDVLGWAPVPLAGGVVEDMDITRSADGTRDVLTLVVRRTIDGATVRYVEELADNRAAELGTVDQSAYNHAFGGAVFSVDPAQTVFNVPHLEGETVYAWTDQGQFGPLTVAAGGDVTLSSAVSDAIIGLADSTHAAETLPIRAQGRDGDTRGRQRRLHGAMGIEVYRTADGTMRVIEERFGQDPFLGTRRDLVPITASTPARPVRSGTARIDAPSGNCEAVRLRFDPVGIAPMTVTAIIPNIEEAGA